MARILALTGLTISNNVIGQDDAAEGANLHEVVWEATGRINRAMEGKGWHSSTKQSLE